MAQKGRWALNGAALDALLGRLDEDRERAALAYEGLRSRLQALAGWWGSIDPLELADRALDRVAMKLEEGAVVPASSLPAYIRSVARLLFYESLREAEREERAQREAPQPAEGDPSAERTLEALDGCLDSLAAAERDLILDYYGGDGGSNSSARRSLAVKLDLSPTALRIRAHRLRERLETCVESSMGGA
jgi:DNA-directed RNA polymerase specialized sigma24 family protein